MTPGERLRAQLRRVGESKARTGAEDVAAHLALAPGQRLERVARHSSTLLSLSRQAAKANPPRDDDVWLRVFRHLHRSAPDG